MCIYNYTYKYTYRVIISGKGGMNLKEIRKGYMREFEGVDRKGKCCNYSIIS